MKQFTRLPSLLRRLPLALLALAAIPTVQAANPAYYAAYELPTPTDLATGDRIYAVAMNDQGYVLASAGQRIFVFLNGQLVDLPYASATLNGATFTGMNPTALSNTAADGSFNVVGNGGTSDGFQRVLFLHVTSTGGVLSAQMLQNRVLGDDSTNPGEQGSASAAAVNNAGVVAGYVSSYLAGLGAFWYPPDIKPQSPFEVYEGPSDLDDAGNFSGTRAAGANSAAEYNRTLLPLPTNIDSRAYRLRNGRIVGEYLTQVDTTYTDYTFVYTVATGVVSLLPKIDDSPRAANQDVKILGPNGEAAGSAYSSVNGYSTSLWLPDPATGAYSLVPLLYNVIQPVYTGYDITADRPGDPGIVGFAADGSFVVNNLVDRYNAATPNNRTIIFKPGADPRPDIVKPDASNLTLHAEPGQPFSYQFSATKTPTHYGLTNTANYQLPAGLTLDPATGLLSGTGPALGAYIFFVAATNDVPALGQKASFVTLVSGDAPVITSGNTASGTVGQPFSFQLTATNSPSNFYATGLPDGVYVDYSTGLVSGTPTKTGTFTVTYQVSNAVSFYIPPYTGANGTLTVTIADAPVPTGPIITSATTASGTVGVPFSYQITTNFAPTYYDTANLLYGLTLNRSTGLITGTPTSYTVGTYQITLRAGTTQDYAETVLTLTIGTSTGPTPTPSPSPNPSPSPTPTPAPGSVDLGVTVTVSPETLVQNATVTYHVAVTNKGVATATGVKVLIHYSPNITFLQGTGTARVSDDSLLVSLPDLPASGAVTSGSASLAFRVNDAGGTVTFGANVSSDQDDSNIFNDNDTLLSQVQTGTPAAHAPTINAPAGGIILTGEPFRYSITTLGDVAVDSYGATGLPDGLAVDAATGVVSGTLAADALPGAASVTLSASNGAGRSTSTRTFTVVTAPAKAADVFATVTGLSVKAPAGDGTTGKYKVTGVVTLTNQGKKPARNVKVGLYLSNSPDFSFPVAAGDPSVSQIPVFLDLSNPLKPTVGLTPAGSTVTTINLPLPLAKKGQAGSSLGPVPFQFKIKAKKVNAAAANYRYLLVVIDPVNSIKETNKTNNVTVIDLQQTP